MKIFRLSFDNIRDQCGCGQCLPLGLISPFHKVSEDFERSLKKLDQELVTDVLLPCHAPLHPDYKKISREIELAHKRLRQVISPHTAYDYGDQVSDEQKQQFIVATDDPSDMNYLQDWTLILVVTHKNRRKLLEQRRSPLAPKHYIYIPPKLKVFDDRLSVRSAYRLSKKFLKAGQELKAMPGLSIFEPRAPIDMEFEPTTVQPRAQSNRSDILLSVIIPVYNQKRYLLETLKHISLQQNIDLQRIEVIVIDDGSSDGLAQEIDQASSIPHLIYHYFKRYVKREMGDYRFRAGIARNLGFKYAGGEHLLFLDADILLPPHGLAQLLSEVKEHDLVQVQRFDLTSEATTAIHHGEFSIDSVQEEHLMSKGRNYWYDFFKRGEDWSHFKHPWKYVCTYGLCLSRATFAQLGGFRNNYLGYGFEDTDLGLRLQQRGGRFHLSSLRTYHQYHEKNRSEYHDSNSQRRRILARTAKTFYYNNLSPEVYECLHSYM